MKDRSRLWLALLLLLPAQASAQARIDSPYRFLDHSQAAGVIAGYLSAEEGPLGAGPQSGPAFGVRYGISLGGPIQLELDAHYVPTQRSVVDTAFTADSARVVRGEADSNLLIVSGSMRFNLTGQRTWHALQPFFALGIGLAADVASSQSADEAVHEAVRFDFGTSFAGSLGAGLEWYPTQRWSARLDLRSFFWKLKAPAPFRTGDQVRAIPADEWERNDMLAAGLAYHF